LPSGAFNPIITALTADLKMWAYCDAKKKKRNVANIGVPGTTVLRGAINYSLSSSLSPDGM
jgi:hypothetical protein